MQLLNVALQDLTPRGFSDPAGVFAGDGGCLCHRHHAAAGLVEDQAVVGFVHGGYRFTTEFIAG